MEQTLFNWHDLVLLLTAFECLAVSLVLFSLRRPLPTTLGLLGLALACYGGIALNEMILWGGTFRYWVLETSPNIFFILSFSYFCAGPLLWLVAQSVLQRSMPKTRQWLHFVPAALFLLYLWATFWTLESSHKVALIQNYQFDNNWHYPLVELASRLHRWIYTILAIRILWPLLTQKIRPLKLATLAGQWSFVLLVLIVSTEVMLTLIKVYSHFMNIPWFWLKWTGLSINYMTFALVNLFLYAWISPLYSKAADDKPKPEEIKIKDTHIEAIEQAIQHEKLFLNPNLSVERFATAIGLPAKELSQTINRHYDMNFIEFINQHRIQEAKEQLEDPNNDTKSITDIFYQAGFNSKSVYNTLFKKTFNCTPSQYRKAAKSNRQSASMAN